ncbi:HVM59 protein, partial [Crotophaga sulcirostris]|nr:HVM59 protein [Crotophaga sulcirostris]
GLWAQSRVAEAGGGLRVHGDSVLLSCRGAGFAFENYGVRWYRQAPSARLEWVSSILYDSSFTKFGPSVEGRAAASWDSLWSKASLSLHALNSQDSALYFCATPVP